MTWVVHWCFARPLDVFHFTVRPNNDYHVKEHKNYIRFPNKNRPFPGRKKVTVVKVWIWNIFKAKNEKIACKSLYRLARILSIDLYDSSEANSSADTLTKFSQAWPLYKGGNISSDLYLMVNIKFAFFIKWNNWKHSTIKNEAWK